MMVRDGGRREDHAAYPRTPNVPGFGGLLALAAQGRGGRAGPPRRMNQAMAKPVSRADVWKTGV